ncbi:exodeoxyribonuclease V subunit beta [Thermoactinomyces sp. CICC 10521]|uniref:UvrD-helicase domain-containing protein n=1 Tax=Thermoactinomyces sp. CICC 10521 TaxID=2767426 RepID=UPI0018DB962C|nr:UvrD-helicase domain-containing protein [Thermoactinomyces sp. CICC 10521]MBH8606110.1 UvrD-helicase domain-containing protein [Thermoactinomyces sp. CICC 10521]
MNKSIHLTEEQKRAVDTLHENSIVYAGAGSGKTRVLTERYLKILEHSRLDPDALERIVAITFTDKAAAEMKERIRTGIKVKRVEALARGEREKANGWRRLLAELSRARISTIHSFCHSLLKRYPLEAGLSPDFDVLDEAVSRALMLDAAEEAIRDGFAAYGEKNGMLRHWLVALGIEEAKRLLAGALERLFQYGWTVKRLREITIRHLDACRTQLEKKRREQLPLWEQSFLEAAEYLRGLRGSKRAEAFRRACPDLPGEWQQRNTVSERLKLLQGIEASIKVNWSKAPETAAALKTCREMHRELVSLYSGMLHLDEEETWLRLFCRLLEQAQIRYQEGKAKRGGVDHDELQWRLCECLERNPAVRAEVQAGISYLLIDEFQDTNELQKRLIDLITKDDRGEVTPGKWFVVGDPKQSIYRFRGADVFLFQQIRAETESHSHGKVHVLSDNFRSHPELISMVNFVFGRIMNQDQGSPNCFQPLRAKREAEGSGGAVEWLRVSEKEELPPGLTEREAEANLVASRIKQMITEENSARPAEIAILLRTMTHVKTWEQALRWMDIPCYVVKGRGFFDQQEVKDILSLLQLLIHPEDHHAWAVVLRSPFCGVSDATITRIALMQSWEGTIFDWSRMAGLDEGERLKLFNFGSFLERMTKMAGSVRIADLLELLVRESGYLTVMWATESGQQVAANLKKLSEQARRLEGFAAFSIPSYLDWMRRLADEQARETEAAIEPEHGDSVKIMTVHQAKGLEFPVVFLPDLHSAPHVRFPECWVDEKSGLVSLLWDENGVKCEPERYQEAKEKNRKMEWEESVRLLYVAMTRAERRLVLSGSLKASKEAGSTKWSEWIIGALGLEGLDSERGEWRFSPDCCPLRLVEIDAGIKEEREKRSALDMMLAGEFDLSRSSVREEPELLLLKKERWDGRDGLEISVTEWKNLFNCPRRHWFAKVMGVPDLREPASPETGSSRAPSGLPATKRGSIVHRIIELLSDPNRGRLSWEETFQTVWEEHGIPDADRQRVMEEIKPDLTSFLHSRFYTERRSGSFSMTETEFTLEEGGLRLHGVIDAVWRRPDGSLEIVDYKTDRTPAGELEQIAQEYLPQLKLYVWACRRKWGFSPEWATLYFLSPNREFTWQVTEEWERSTASEIRQSMDWLRAGKENILPAKPGRHCRYCPCQWLCDEAEGGNSRLQQG